MYFLGAPGFRELLVAGLAASIIGYLIAWLLDRYLLKLITDDRVSGIALSCALTFVLMMGTATYFLTTYSPFGSSFQNSPIIIPPFGYAISFLIGVALAGVIRMQVYARQYQWNDDQAYFEPDYNDLSRYDHEVLAWDERNAGRNYLQRHWAGHLSLPVSYWINSALLSVLLLVATAYLTGRLGSGSGSLRSIAMVALAYMAVSTILWVWSSVGVWRSAYWHRRRGGTAFWGFAARCLVLLSLVLTIVRSQSLGLQVAEWSGLLLGHDSIGTVADMTVSADGRSLVLRGNIAQGADEKFGKVLDSGSSIREVVLTSPGGRMLEAERMAARIRQRKLNTRVDDECSSACISLLLAGELRSAPHRAQIGFHQPSFPGLSAAEMRGATEEVRRKYIAAGVEPTFLWRALATPAEDIWVPTWDQLLEANVLTQPEIVIYSSKSHRDRRDRVSADSLSGKRLAKDLAAQAVAINEKTPLRIDQITTLDRATASGFTLTHHYTLRTTRLDVAPTRRAMSAILREQVCADRSSSSAIHDGADITFSYRDGSGKHLFDVAISDCG